MLRCWVLVVACSVASAACVDSQDDELLGSIERAATVCAAGETVAGIDVSKWQGQIDWPTVRGSGVEFAFIRVSDGLGYVDERFDANWTGAKQSGVLRGAYQFFRAGSDAIAQADLVIDAVGSIGVGDLPPVLDIESLDGQSPQVVVDKALVWLQYVEQQLGVRPIVYTGGYFWDGAMEGHEALAEYGLWVPQWGPACPNIPAAWDDWLFFQHSDSGSVPGIAGAVDLDVFNGDRAALESLVSGQAAEPCGLIAAEGGLVDDDHDCFHGGGDPKFIRNETAGFGDGLKWTYATDLSNVANYGRWDLNLHKAGRYRVDVYTPAPHAQSRLAEYQIAHGGAETVVSVDQTAVDGWSELGVFDFESGGGQWIRVDDNTGESQQQSVQLVFDAVRLVRVGDDTDAPTPDWPADSAADESLDNDAGAAGCQAGGRGMRASWASIVLVAVIGLGRRRRRAGSR